MTPTSNADDEVTADVEETVKVRTTFREKMRNLSGFLLEQVKPLLAGGFGLGGLDGPWLNNFL